MKHLEKITPVAAAFSAAATLTCCLPATFAAAALTASLGAAAMAYRPWFLGASILLLALGGVQVTRARRACRPGARVSIVVLAVCAAIVLIVTFFPQAITSRMAAWLS
jgi:hypothetical protein